MGHLLNSYQRSIESYRLLVRQQLGTAWLWSVAIVSEVKNELDEKCITCTFELIVEGWVESASYKYKGNY